MQPGAFSIARLPRIEFGRDAFARVPDILARFGGRAMLVTGARSFPGSRSWEALIEALGQRGVVWHHVSIDGEPSPQGIDAIVGQYADTGIDVVLGVGGGSALDAAKAIAGLLRVQRSVMDYLEGVGPELPYTGPAVPLIAAPTTAGTGSEATKNAVLSVQGAAGFKKSFRDERLVAEYAVVDPALLATCPRQVIAANGMDALTQLLESLVSLRANPFTDALAISGLQAVRDGLLDWYEHGSAARAAQERMAYAALLSGITLAQCGLGSVHGLASPLGAFHPIPHGVVCGTLVGTCTAINIEALLARAPDSPALDKYAEAARIICGQDFGDRASAWQGLVHHLAEWTERLELPRLGAYGLDDQGLDRVVAHSRGSSMQTNPVVLTDAEIRTCLEQRL
ncbi:MAG: iron-containing alcohol dehydrogenase [Gammaproteobacteria bacterium]|jgi:alcohol dehydrogenase